MLHKYNQKKVGTILHTMNYNKDIEMRTGA